MPWSPKDAKAHTKKATTKTARRQWADVADKVRAETGDDARAIREANAVLKRRKAKEQSK